MLKKVLVVALILALLAAAGVYAVFRNLDALVASVIEDAGSRATQAPVSVESVRLKIAEGTGAIARLRVGNPDGFATPHAFDFGAVRIQMDPEAVTRSPIVVRRVTVDECDVNYEWSTGGSNIARIEENVAAFVAGLAPPGKADPAEKGAKLVIEQLVIEGGRIQVSASFLGGRQVTAPLQRIVLEDVGAEQGGATPGQIAAAVLAALTGGVLETVAGLGIDGLDEVRKLGEGLLDAAGRALDSILGR